MRPFEPGDRVVHPKCPDWGVGQVVREGTGGGRVRALFERGGLRTVLAEQLAPAPPPEKRRTAKPPW